MSEPRDDLREALARWLNDRFSEFARGAQDEADRASIYRLADDCLAGPFAPILAQVSALQAEVEAARALNRDLHRRVQKAKSFRARHGNTYGVKARWRDRQRRRKAEAERDEAIKDMEASEAHAYGLDEKLASLSPHGTCACSYDRPGDVCMHHSPALTEALAEVERLQKVEGERGRLERALAVSLAFLDMAAGEGLGFVETDGGSPAMEASDICEMIAETIGADIGGPIWIALRDTGRKSVTDPQAPSDNPLTETKEGSEHV